MATTSLWRIKGAIGDVIRYAENEKKTTKEILPEEKARQLYALLYELLDNQKNNDKGAKNNEDSL